MLTLLLYVFLVALAPLLGILGSFALYWYEIAATPHHAVFLRQAAGRPALLVARLVLLCLGSQILAVLTMLLGLATGPYAPPRPGKGPVVVLVHGLYHSCGGFLPLMRWLRAAGFTQMYAPTLDTFRCQVPELAQHLRQHLDAIAARHPGQPLLLVGHSLGGLVIRAALGRQPAWPVAAVATIATPHRGSKLAALGPSTTARALLPGSPLLRGLADQYPPDVPWLCLCSNYDNIVLPPENLLPPPGAPWQVAKVGVHSHVSALFAPRVARRIAEFFHAALAGAPAPLSE